MICVAREEWHRLVWLLLLLMLLLGKGKVRIKGMMERPDSSHPLNIDTWHIQSTAAEKRLVTEQRVLS